MRGNILSLGAALLMASGAAKAAEQWKPVERDPSVREVPFDANFRQRGVTLYLTAGEALTARELVFVKSDGKVWLADLGSRNGTRVGHQPVEGGRRMNRGAASDEEIS